MIYLSAPMVKIVCGAFFFFLFETIAQILYTENEILMTVSSDLWILAKYQYIGRFLTIAWFPQNDMLIICKIHKMLNKCLTKPLSQF